MKIEITKWFTVLSLFTFAFCHDEAMMMSFHDENNDDSDQMSVIDFDVEPSVHSDPFDMFNYDPSTLRHPAKKLTRKTEKDIGGETGNIASCGEKNFLKRFTQLLYSTMQLGDKTIEEGEVLHIPLTALVTKRTVSVLQLYMNREEETKQNMIADLDEIFLEMLILSNQPIRNLPADTRQTSPFEGFYNLNLQPKDWLMIIFAFYFWIMLVAIYYHYSVWFMARISFLLLFGVSWFWHWNYLYQVSTAMKQSHAMKNREMPSDCYQGSNPVISWPWSSGQSCEEYHKMMLIDAGFEISPLAAVMDLLLKTILNSAEYVGEKLGKFFYQLTAEIGWLRLIPSLVFVGPAFTIFTVLLMVMMCGYEIHLPFWFKFARPQSGTVYHESLKQSEPIAALPQTTQSQRPSVVILRVASSSAPLPSPSSQVQRIENNFLDIFEDCAETDIDALALDQIIEEIRDSSPGFQRLSFEVE